MLFLSFRSFVAQSSAPYSSPLPFQFSLTPLPSAKPRISSLQGPQIPQIFVLLWNCPSLPLCLSYFLANITKYLDCRSLKEKEFILACSSKGIQSFRMWQEQKAVWPCCIHTQEAGNKQEMGPGNKASRPAPSSPHIPAEVHLLKVPQASQTVHQLGTKHSNR